MIAAALSAVAWAVLQQADGLASVVQTQRAELQAAALARIQAYRRADAPGLVDLLLSQHTSFAPSPDHCGLAVLVAALRGTAAAQEAGRALGAGLKHKGRRQSKKAHARARRATAHISWASRVPA
jgi:hypothetical protein